MLCESRMSDRFRALVESVAAFALIMSPLAILTIWPLWTYILIWFATCLAWPSKPILWKKTHS
jgi:hypothetical protein